MMHIPSTTRYGQVRGSVPIQLQLTKSSPSFDRRLRDRESAATLQRSVAVASAEACQVDRLPRLRLGAGNNLTLGVRMVAMARSGGGASPNIGASRDAVPPGARREAARQSSVEAALNRMSKWLVAGGFTFAALWKRDAEIMWVFLGAIANRLLSKILKKMLNHERPTPGLRSDPGMPSSHAQSIFYAATVLVLSLFHWLRTNSLAMILVPAILSVATYLSWLRVSQGLHTRLQVIVGAAVGSGFGVLWSVLWRSLVREALPTSPLLQNSVILGSAVFCVGYIIRHWLRHE